jgi:hemoglobin
MKDIILKSDLELLLKLFYDKLLKDNSINYIFTEVIKINLEHHLPILVTFWSQVLFGTGGYTNNLTQIHLDINTKEYLTPELFTIWLTHFNASVDENFKGENAEKIKTQALNIATVLQIKISQEKRK